MRPEVNPWGASVQVIRVDWWRFFRHDDKMCQQRGIVKAQAHIRTD